jgi:PAS domain S-box-containing protein
MSSSDHTRKTKQSSDIDESHLFKFSVENAADVIFWIDREGRITYVNRAGVDVLGYSSDELLTMFVYDIDLNHEKKMWESHWHEVKKLGEATILSEHIKKSGEIFPVEIRVKYLEFDSTEFLCAFVRDITARKEAERLLKENEERLRLTLDVTSDGMWDRDIKTDTVYYGSKWATALGYEPEDLSSGKVRWDLLLHPDDREKTLQAVKDHLKGKTENYVAEFRLLNSRKEWQWMLARGQVIEKDEQGNPLRFVGTHTDITARKYTEKELVRSSEQIKMFAYSVVHDLKNPAIAIQGLAQRLHKNIENLPVEKQKRYCKHLLQSSEQIVRLVEKVNSFIATRETTIHLEKVSLKELVRTIRGEFARQLQKREISWYEFQAKPVVIADRISLMRVLRNFVENSLNYGGDGLSKISISYQDTPGYHVLSVRDNGVGMNKEAAESIFKPFERSHTSAGKCGSGLGLAIVKEIAGSHKGEVWIEHKTKKGIRFCFAISKFL